MEWTGQVYADCPAVAAQAYIEAAPDRVWPLVCDIYLMPGLSAEVQEVAWLDGVTGPALGCRFVGRNANEYRGTWETVSTVIECDEPRRFAWAVGDPATRWRPGGSPCGPTERARCSSSGRGWARLAPA